MIGRRLMTVALVAMTLAGCARLRVSTDYDRTATFNTLRTYSWRLRAPQDADDPRIDNAVFDQHVRGAIDRVLPSKGYQPAAPDTAPSFLVGYHAVLRQKTSVQSIDSWYGYRLSAWGWPKTRPHDYEEGTLLIDVITPDGMKLLWRGTGIGVVDPTASVKKREQRINDAVEKILSDFPPH